MDCPSCGAKWYVKNTAAAGDAARKHLVDRGKLVQWYTHDYIVRARVCKACAKRSYTIEVEIADLDNMLRIASNEGLPDNILRPQGSKGKDPC